MLHAGTFVFYWGRPQASPKTVGACSWGVINRVLTLTPFPLKLRHVKHLEIDLNHQNVHEDQHEQIGQGFCPNAGPHLTNTVVHSIPVCYTKHSAKPIMNYMTP